MVAQNNCIVYDIHHPFNTKFEVDDPVLVKQLTDDGKAYIRKAYARTNVKKDMRRSVIIHANHLSDVGGIETLLLNVSKTFPEYNVTLLYGNADANTIIALSENYDCIKYCNENYKCDVAILMNCDSQEIILDHLDARKIYNFYGHQDWRVFDEIKDEKYWRDKNIFHHDRCIALSVSEAAQHGLEERLGIKSQVANNLLLKEEPLRLFSATRLTNDKGISNLFLMVDEMHASKIPFVWFITYSHYADPNILRRLRWYPEVVLIEASHSAKHLIKGMDWCICTSQAEAFYYAGYEAHQFGVPVIMLECEQAHAVADIIYRQDLQDFNPQDLLKKITVKQPSIQNKWKDLLDGKF